MQWIPGLLCCNILQESRWWQWLLELHLPHYHYGTLFLSIYLCTGVWSIHPPIRQSIQLQTIMEHYHLVCLAKGCQWPRAAQYPPLISLAPTTKDLEHQVLSPGSMLAICAPDRMEKQCWVAACMQDVQGDTDQCEGCGWVSKMSIDCQAAAHCQEGPRLHNTHWGPRGVMIARAGRFMFVCVCVRNTCMFLISLCIYMWAHQAILKLNQ